MMGRRKNEIDIIRPGWSWYKGVRVKYSYDTINRLKRSSVRTIGMRIMNESKLVISFGLVFDLKNVAVLKNRRSNTIGT